MSERWLPVVGFDGYEVSDLGRLRSWRGKGFGAGKRRRVPLTMRAYITRQGYLRVALRLNGRWKQMVVHRLVLEAFIGPPPDGHECAHGDGNKRNNALSNLRWVTPKQNAVDRFAHGTQPVGVTAYNAKLTDVAVRDIRQRTEASHIVAAEYGVASGTVRKIRRGEVWKHTS